MSNFDILDQQQKLTALRSMFFKTDRVDQLEREFNKLLYRRIAERDSGQVFEARGLCIVGESGSGKSTSLRRLFAKHDHLVLAEETSPRTDVISLSVPSPATPKHVGLACLTALGYPLRRDRTSGVIWELAQIHLQARQTLFLHLDEAQDFSNNRNERDMAALINTLKSLMQHREWPVGVILSGMPILLKLVNYDPQLSRRIIPVHLRSLQPNCDQNMVFAALKQYTSAAELELSEELKTPQFIQRLVHACVHEFGIVIELTIEAIERAFESCKSQLLPIHFAQSFQRRSGCVADLNPFLAEDYSRINARHLLGQMQIGTGFAQ